MRKFILGLIIVFIVFSVGCNRSPTIEQISTENQKTIFTYENISSLNNTYLLDYGNDIDINTSNMFIIHRLLLPSNFYTPGFFENSRNEIFEASLWILKNVNMKKTMRRYLPALIDFDSSLAFSDSNISLNQCKVKIRDNLYSGTTDQQIIAKCSDSETTLFISVVSNNKQLAYQVLNDIYSAVSS